MLFRSVENLLSALVTLLLCLGTVRLVTTLARRALNRTRLDGRIKDYVLRGLRFLLYTVTALIVAESLGIPASSLVALLSVFALAVSLAVQDVLSNVAGGLVLLFSKPFTLGDYIESADGEGTVYSIGLTHTVLDTYGGQRVMLPNSRLTAGKQTIISTNLSERELEQQYTPQIASRLLGEYQWLHFLGTDIRRR